ncbi:hypothetical protein PCANC_10652 [Puccinia coronata f. sp. avenae]|uniref:ATPase domain-containing protein n=1 Tax=Puccinia coronata f. sp. avenae TaxID=200324 RepID=A0A2N5V464_9BASI|nr:hypothetical protein PCANC_10652 [Puccinia coronata f. sp. avenae]
MSGGSGELVLHHLARRAPSELVLQHLVRRALGELVLHQLSMRAPGGLALIASLLPLSRISRRFFHNNHVPIPLFKRTRETNDLSILLKSRPELTMLLGPPSSGKTTLAKQITSQLQDDGIPKFHPLTIDLRSVDTTREGAFLEAFLDNAKIAGKRSKVWKDLTSEMLVSFGPLSTKVGGSKLSSGTSAENVFKQLGDSLEPQNFRHGKRSPVLVFDQANFFQHMSDKIQAFFNFAIQISKKEGKMHVILTSSDCFCDTWLSRRINPAHFESVVVGDLSRLEAYNYFLKLVENNQHLSEEDKSHLRSIDFNIPYKMTGGRMYFIDKYITQIFLNDDLIPRASEFILDHERCHWIFQERLGAFHSSRRAAGPKTWGSDLAKAPLNPISSESVVAAVVFPVPRIVDSSY